MSSYTVLLYYKYTSIHNLEDFLSSQKQICTELDLKGRVIIASEGINGTLEGLTENIEKYCQELSSQPNFKDLHFKKSVGDGLSFPKLSIKIRSEIVSGHLSINPNRLTGKYLSPQELRNWFETKKEFYIIDMRNDYEHKSGYFEGSILPRQLKNFRDVPKILPSISHLKDKTILTVCTGGVRCETASGFLLENGFSDVYQLDGGIVSYMEKYPNQDFLGKLYVFDQRMLIGFNTNSPQHTVVGKCAMCSTASENYINIRNTGTRTQIICCQNCIDKGLAVAD